MKIEIEVADEALSEALSESLQRKLHQGITEGASVRKWDVSALAYIALRRVVETTVLSDEFQAKTKTMIEDYGIEMMQELLAKRGR